MCQPNLLGAEISLHLSYTFEIDDELFQLGLVNGGSNLTRLEADKAHLAKRKLPECDQWIILMQKYLRICIMGLANVNQHSPKRDDASNAKRILERKLHAITPNRNLNAEIIAFKDFLADNFCMRRN